MQRLITFLKMLYYRLWLLWLPKTFLHKGVPYFSQRESRELNREIHDKIMRAEDDPKWRQSGAVSRKEYAAWSWAGCGMACTKMLLAHITGKVIPLVHLGKECIEYGGYTLPLEKSQGLLYKPYVSFLREEYGLRAHIIQQAPLEELLYYLGKDNYVIASVHPSIRHPESIPPSKGGHLILLLGFDKRKREVYFHNPSGYLPETQEYATLSFSDFAKFFSGRGIVVRA